MMCITRGCANNDVDRGSHLVLHYPGPGPAGTDLSARCHECRPLKVGLCDTVANDTPDSASGGLDSASSDLGHDALMLAR